MRGHEWGKHEKVHAHANVPPLTLLRPPPTTFAHDLATNIELQLVKAKITVTLTGLYRNWGEMNEAWKQGQGDMVIASWHHRTSQPDDPDRYLHALFHSSSGANWGKYKEVDSLLENKEHEKAVKQIKSDVPIVPLVDWKRFSAYRTGLGLELEAGALPKDRLVNVKI
jgi:ABC-type transport system substrate-binding protein